MEEMQIVKLRKLLVSKDVAKVYLLVALSKGRLLSVAAFSNYSNAEIAELDLKVVNKNVTTRIIETGIDAF